MALVNASYDYFLGRVIDDGIAAARKSYKDASNKLEGSIAGFEACRGKNPLQLKILFDTTRGQAHVHEGNIEDYWRARCYELEIEWVCNVLSAALHNEGRPPIAAHLPTARAMMKAAEILGVASVH